jgi:hypothetical protein
MRLVGRVVEDLAANSEEAEVEGAAVDGLQEMIVETGVVTGKWTFVIVIGRIEAASVIATGTGAKIEISVHAVLPSAAQDPLHETFEIETAMGLWA